jgi:flagellar biosynthesis/type III secretory pathway chaperone
MIKMFHSYWKNVMHKEQQKIMAGYIDRVEILFQEKIRLYRMLLDILRQESECILQKDLDALWQFAAEKKAAVEGIEKVRQQILKTLSEASITHGMDPRSFDMVRMMRLLTPDDRRVLNRIHGPLQMLKRQIHNLSRKNQQYVHQYLAIVKDLMELMTNAGPSHRSYGRKSPAYGYQRGGMNMLFHARV